MKATLLALLTFTLLAGCNSKRAPLDLEVVKGMCPPLTKFTDAQLKQAAYEIRRLPKGSIIKDGMMPELAKIRQACRITE